MVHRLIYSFIILAASFPIVVFGLTIDTNNHASYLFGQGGSITQKGMTLQYTSDTEQSIMLIQPNSREVVDRVVFENLKYDFNTVGFVWKFKNQDFQESNQLQLTVTNGVVLLPQNLQLNDFDILGFIFFSKSISFEALSLTHATFLDKYTSFWGPELVRPSTINLLYGAKWGDVAFVKILGVLALILFVVLFFLNTKWALFSLLILWIVFDIRYMYDRWKIFEKTRSEFVLPSLPHEKIYFDFHNLYGFIASSKKFIDGDVNFYAPTEWPFAYNYTYHMLPLKATWRTTDKPFYAIFQQNVEWQENGDLIIDGKLIDSVELIHRFDNRSYIFKKK